MKTFEDKKNIILDMASLYLDSTKDRVNNIDSINFLILKALILPKEDTNIYAQDIEIDDETIKEFVDIEYNKISDLSTELIKKGKIILDDANVYYNRKFNNISIEEINKIAQELDRDGFHI